MANPERILYYNLRIAIKYLRFPRGIVNGFSNMPGAISITRAVANSAVLALLSLSAATLSSTQLHHARPIAVQENGDILHQQPIAVRGIIGHGEIMDAVSVGFASAATVPPPVVESDVEGINAEGRLETLTNAVTATDATVPTPTTRCALSFFFPPSKLISRTSD